MAAWIELRATLERNRLSKANKEGGAELNDATANSPNTGEYDDDNSIEQEVSSRMRDFSFCSIIAHVISV